MAKSALWLELGSAGWVAIYVLLAPWLGLLLPIVNIAIYPCGCHVAHGGPTHMTAKVEDWRVQLHSRTCHAGGVVQSQTLEAP